MVPQPNVKALALHYWPWILAVVVAGVIIFFFFRKKTVTLSNLPDNGQPQENDQLTDTEKTEVKRLATALYNELKGTKWDFIWGRDPQPFNDLASASDRVTVGTFNYFNVNFGNGDTLWNWINSDWYWSTGDSWHSIELIKSKFSRLGLI